MSWCRDAHGRPCSWDSESVASFSVLGAMRAAGSDDVELLAAWGELERIVAPMDHLHNTVQIPRGDAPAPVIAAFLQLLRLGPAPLITGMNWFEVETRTIGEVLRAFDKAINRTRGQRNG